ncbi:zf-HC2 domain-containing protein [Runella sp. MFBS21]|uniref:zf-HC2 domain-containing protein n=1 Tax=Runella sp. MFBS21 TaxID=3034018 RepID=UPI0023F6A4BE|nr:zf-HC2 domain-containing protein [Runella sp. MFBS21]MDF7817272.1 zf-HC2 domain-containing protein [Runella sp. MFBS21]
MEPNNIDLIEAYLDGTLSDDENAQIEHRMAVDDNFYQQVQYQLGFKKFYEQRFQEIEMRTEMLSFIDNHQTVITKVKAIERVRDFVTKYAAQIAVVIMVGIGTWIWWNAQNTETLLLTKNIEKVIIPDQDNAFGEGQEAISENITLQLFKSPRSEPNNFTYQSKVLTIYHPDPEIVNAKKIKLVSLATGYRLDCDSISYKWIEKEPGRGQLKRISP